jgi:uncharacterized protein (DUF2062 family)
MDFAATRPAVILPTFNNARTLGSIIAQTLETGLPVIVVDDGCSDETSAVLAEFVGKIQAIRHPRNRGKAAAMRSGFAAAGVAGFTHAITIDTDGQLDPAQIPQFVERCIQNPHALIIGVRDENSADYPYRSRAGRRVSNLLVQLQSGLKVSDSQCGFRVYPLDFIKAVKCSAERFGFETEIITRAGWAGCSIEEIPVTCTYGPVTDRVSHFQPWRDSLRAVAMHTRLFVRAIIPWPHAKWPAITPNQKTNWLKWISPRQAWRELREECNGRARIALSIGVGVLIANLPIYPGQTLAALYAARRLHLNPLATVLGTQASMPPMNFALIAGAIFLGHFLLHGTSIAVSWNQIHHLQLWRSAGVFAVDWIIGGILLGCLLGAAAFGLVLALLTCIPLKERVRA